MASAAERVPMADGENERATAQFAAGAREAGQVLVCPKSPALVPAREILAMARGALPELVSVTV